MSMFELNKDVPETLLPKNGKYSAVINKVEEKTSSKGSAMLAVEMTIPVTDPSMVEQKMTFPQKVFDYIVDSDAVGCQVKKNAFLRATKVTSAADLVKLVGKQVDIKVRGKTDDYGEKLEVTTYVADSIKDANVMPF